MKKARLSDQAKEDLVGIWDYITQDNPSAADRLLQKLVKQFESLPFIWKRLYPLRFRRPVRLQ